MGEQLFLERYFWFDQEIRNRQYPNAAKLARRFECSAKTAQRSIEFFRCRLYAPLAYDPARRGFYYNDPDFQLSCMRLSEQELLSLLVSPSVPKAIGGPCSRRPLASSRTGIIFRSPSGFLPSAPGGYGARSGTRTSKRRKCRMALCN